LTVTSWDDSSVARVEKQSIGTLTASTLSRHGPHKSQAHFLHATPVQISRVISEFFCSKRLDAFERFDGPKSLTIRR